MIIIRIIYRLCTPLRSSTVCFPFPGQIRFIFFGRRMLTGKSQSWLVLLCLFCGVRRSSQLFRFCHRGVWHQLLEGDCPHGLLFNEQLQTPCYYTVRDKGADNNMVPRIWPRLCDEPNLNQVEEVTDDTSGDSLLLAKKNGQIRMIEFDSAKYDVERKTRKNKDLISIQSCESRCYRDIFEEPFPPSPSTSSSHESSDSLEAPHHIPRPKLSPNDLAAVRDQTLRLGDYLFDQIPSPDENPGPRLRIVDLFKRSIKILGKTCQHPFISSNFLNRVLYGFLFLVIDSGVGELEDISVEEFEEIMVALNGCDEKAPDFRLEGTICETNGIVREVIKILPNGTEYTAPFQLTQLRSQLENKPSSSVEAERKMLKMNNPDYDGGGQAEGDFHSSSDDMRGQGSFPYDELDVFTEAAWSAVQVTHATCFATFKPNSNMHHRYVSAMEQLFSGKIQDRWRNPTVLIHNEMWGTWFLADVDLTFTNLQACIRAAYLDAPFVMRLDRPIDPIRSSPSISRYEGNQGLSGTARDKLPEGLGGSNSKMKRKKKKPNRRKRESSGAQHLPDPDYWDTYSANGGIRHKLPDEIQCFQNPEEKDKAVSLLKDQCKTGNK